MESEMELNGKKVYDIELQGIRGGNSDFSDAFVSCACWANGIDLTEEELDELNNQTAELHEYIFSQLPL